VHPRVSTRPAAIVGLGVSGDGGTWRDIDGARPVLEWAWAGRMLFTVSSGATEFALGSVPVRAVRLEIRLPYRGEGAVTSVCVRGAA
jgi:hypothetical protein